MGSGSACRRGRSKPVLRRLIRYSEKIFDLGEVLGEVSDRRLRPRIPPYPCVAAIGFGPLLGSPGQPPCPGDSSRGFFLEALAGGRRWRAPIRWGGFTHS